MSESFRPHESSSIDAGLRTRLEGTIELLEDALPLMDSLMDLLGRVENSRDDLATLQECVTQLPRIDEAIEKANRHEQAIALTQAVGQRKQAAHRAANDRLVALGQAEAPSLRAATSAVLDLLRQQGTAPRSDETQLASSVGPPWGAALFLGLVVSALLYSWVGAIAGALLGALFCLVTLYAKAATPWVLLPDRVYFPARWPKMSRQISPGSIERVDLADDRVTAHVGNAAVTLATPDPKYVGTLLRILRSPWLSGLKSPASWSATLEATNLNSNTHGRALVSADGVLFIPEQNLELVHGAITSEPLPVFLSRDQLFGLISHLPGGAWAGLGEHLMKTTDAKWLPRRDLTIEDSIAKAGDERVRLNLNLTSKTEVLTRLGLI